MKNKGVIILIVIAVIIIGIITAKNNSIKTSKKEEINVVLGSEPSSLDPAISLTIDVRSYLTHLFEGLVRIDSKGQVQEGMADKWEFNKDKTEVKFHIRENAKWSDGSKVTAEDFKYAWLRVLDPKTASGWASFLYYIKGAEKFNLGETKSDTVGIEVIDDNNLKVKLESPCSFFISMTALQPYYPVKKSIINKYGEKWTQEKKSFVTNGAYTLKKWTHDSKIEIEKSENYWNNKNVYINNINFMLYADSNAILNVYQSGELDYVETMLTSDEMKQVDKLRNSDFVYTKFLALNLNSNVFKDDKVRKAIAIALDRTEISKKMGSEISPLTTFIPYGFYNGDEKTDYTKDSNAKKYLEEKAQLEEAKKLLEEAGYKDGKGLPKVTYLTNNSSSNIALAELVKSQLEKIGIKVNIQALEKKVFNEYRKDKKFDIVAASWAAEYPDITSYLYGFRSNDINNYASFKSKEFDQKYAKILQTEKTKDKFKLTHEAENLVIESYSIIPLYSEKTTYISNKNLVDYYHDVTGCLNFTNSIVE